MRACAGFVFLVCACLWNISSVDAWVSQSTDRFVKRMIRRAVGHGQDSEKNDASDRRSVGTGKSAETHARAPQTHVAVCVIGMPARFQPYRLAAHLQNANANRKFSFHTFYVLQNTSKQWFSTIPGASDGKSSSWVGHTHGEMMKRLKQHVTGEVRLSYQDEIDWKQYFMNTSLDVMTEYSELVETKVLNLLQHYERCARDIIEAETANGNKFDYVIATREDAYAFHDIHLQALIDRLDGSNCDIMAKDCLSGNGINLRFMFMKRRKAIDFLSTGISSYGDMLHSKAVTSNTEQFLQSHARRLEMKSCFASIEHIPVAVGRLHKSCNACERSGFHGSSDDPVCFLYLEVADCTPVNSSYFVSSNMCDGEPSP